eukprot:CAMPEP_0169389724 /NCGR_PEP_ID=MMETSP1017-20121227/46906_1 /TAXON_ID=342587 /ORGANISM="Karlodinium micrum, Strain CCMP2283" /LENGTH=285 /DNA_ID=CAMNT_0009491953 /DNA_START=123 /DNA_END=980 /DNA_ORIENTATION=+
MQFPEAYSARQDNMANGMHLAGKLLEPPHFFETGWSLHQRFKAEDDPDRTREPWEPPGFVRTKDPILQRQKTVAENLHLDRSIRQTAHSFACVVHHVLDEEDCAALIASVNKKGFTPALTNIGGGNQALMPETRDGHRVIVDSPEFALWLLEVLRPHLPVERPFRGRGSPCDLVDLNERCRFLCYSPGQHFEPHWDALYERPSSHSNAGDFSSVTVQIYLHSVPQESGGATTFLKPDGSPVLPCQPGAGSVLLFSQDLYHEGSRLISGLKYTLRTEAMYRYRRAS